MSGCHDTNMNQDEPQLLKDLIRMAQDINSLHERIRNLEAHKNYQIDENRKEFKHIEELEIRIEHLENFLNTSPGEWNKEIPESKL